MSEIENFTRDELYQFAQEADITGRGDMDKSELWEALKESAPHLLHPFAAVDNLEIGDTVNMNHLKTDLMVTEIQHFDAENKEITRVSEEEENVVELEDENIPEDYSDFTTVTMETNRGGRHQLVCQKGSEVGPAPWKNEDEPHLRRWRAGDSEWMNNSTDPTFIRPVTEEEDSDDDEEDSDDAQ
jgi:hypothetical protein